LLTINCKYCKGKNNFRKRTDLKHVTLPKFYLELKATEGQQAQAKFSDVRIAQKRRAQAQIVLGMLPSHSALNEEEEDDQITREDMAPRGVYMTHCTK
jgi:hypothetical protein